MKRRPPRNWFFTYRNGKTFVQHHVNKLLLNFIVVIFIIFSISSIVFSTLYFSQKQATQALTNDLLSASEVVRIAENILSGKNVSSLTKQQVSLLTKKLQILKKQGQNLPSKVTETRSALNEILTVTSNKYKSLVKAKQQQDLLVSILTSEISGNRSAKTDLEIETKLLLKRIISLEDNLEFQRKKNKNLVSSLNIVLERLSGVVGLPVLLDSDAVLTANILANRLQNLFVAQSDILKRLTTETNKATLQAAHIIEKAGFDPAQIITLPPGIENKKLENDTSSITDHDISINSVNNSVYNNFEVSDKSSLNSANSDFTGQGGPFIPELQLNSNIAGEVFGSDLGQLINAVNSFDEADLFVKCIPIGTPVSSGRVTSGYGPRVDPLIKGKVGVHYGFDIANHLDTPIYATGSGRVVFVNWAGAFGRLITIEHGCGFKTRYAHLNKQFVKPNDYVKAGQVIGTMGSSGRSTGSHVHYEIIHKGRHFNPLKILRIEHYDLW